MAAFDRLKVKPGLAPMEAKLVDALPDGEGWHYEPKWDGFRCLVFRDGAGVELQSKSGKPLARYFPEVADLIRRIEADRFVLDGELVIPVGQALSFEALQMRLHPAESRIRKLARETPAQLVLFDCLETAGQALLERPLVERRAALERFHGGTADPALQLSPCARERGRAQDWLDSAGAVLDGVIAKRRDGSYQPGERAMLKIKQLRSADCVVGGFRYASKEKLVGSLLLGLYNEQGLLDHVGFTSTISNAERAELTARLEALRGPPGFPGNAPGGPSRWSTERSGDWEPLRSELVVEVVADLDHQLRPQRLPVP